MKSFNCKFFCFFLLVFITSKLNAQTEIWGMSRYGGSSGLGTIFKTDGNGDNPVLIHSFTDTLNGFNPEGSLIQMRNRKLYGMTKYGGIHNMGTLFEFDMFTNTLLKLVDFDSINTGCYPSGTLYNFNYSSDLHGMNGKGGLNDLGVKFTFNTNTGVIHTGHHFDSITGGETANSSMIFSPDSGNYGYPNYRLICANPRGGINNQGVIFKYEPYADSILYNISIPPFAGGSLIQSDLLEVNPGVFLGLSVTGGDSSGGYLFEFIQATGTVNQKASFNTSTGTSPQGKLIQGKNGKYYGMCSAGGLASQGTLFEYDYILNQLTSKADFGATLNDISAPHGSLLGASNGKLYGMGTYGSNCGSILFEYDIYTNLLIEKTNLCSSINVIEPYNTTLIEVDGDSTHSVWPGDCNYDQVVNNLDFLFLGVAYLETGPVRQGAITDYIAQHCADWSLFLNISSFGPVNAKNLDSDGNGIVDSLDATAIYLNYGKTHLFRKRSSANNFYSHDIMCLIPVRNPIAPGDPAEFEIRIGGIDPPVDSVYGMAFSIQFDPLLADTNRISVDFNPSILGNPGFDLMTFRQNKYSSGLIHLGIVRKDRVNYFNPGGSIGTLKIYTKNSISSPVQLHVLPQDILSVDASGRTYDWHPCAGDILIDPGITSIDDSVLNNAIRVYPNPVNNDVVFISNHIKGLKDSKAIIRIFDLTGKISMQTEKNFQDNDPLLLSIAGLSKGMYFIQLQFEKYPAQFQMLIVE